MEIKQSKGAAYDQPVGMKRVLFFKYFEKYLYPHFIIFDIELIGGYWWAEVAPTSQGPGIRAGMYKISDLLKKKADYVSRP